MTALTSCLLSLTILGSTGAEDPLETALAGFWDALARKDKAAAQYYVVAEDRNTFLNMDPLPVRSWEVDEIQRLSEDQARVALRIEIFQIRAASGGAATRIVQKWVRSGDSWLVHIPAPSVQKFRKLFSSRRPVAADPPSRELDVLSERVEIPYLNRSQVGTIEIRNGLNVPAEIVSVQLDAERFEVYRNPGTVDAESTGKIVIRYTGDETEKELTSEIVLILRHGDEQSTFTIPVLYNHLNRATRNFFGLTDEEARKLRRSDPVEPAVQLSEDGQRRGEEQRESVPPLPEP